jgi:hypothetical protein
MVSTSPYEWLRSIEDIFGVTRRSAEKELDQQRMGFKTAELDKPGLFEWEI